MDYTRFGTNPANYTEPGSAAVPEGSYFYMNDGRLYKKSGRQAIPIFGTPPDAGTPPTIPISPSEWNRAGTVVPDSYGINLKGLKPVLAKSPNGSGGINLYQDAQGNFFNDPEGKQPVNAPQGMPIVRGQTYDEALNDTTTPRVGNRTLGTQPNSTTPTNSVMGAPAANNFANDPRFQSALATGKYTLMLDQRGEPILVNKGEEQLFTNSGFSYPAQNSTTQQNSPNIAQNNQTGQPSQNDFQNFSDLPDNIKNSASWQSLSNDQKSLAYFTYKTQIATTDAQKIDAQKALEEAKKLADPYFKEQIRLAQDEINRSVSSIKNDAQSKVAQLQTRIQQIQEDLKFNKDNLTIDQQTELASQIRKNEGDLFNLQQNMAESGLAFSSPRQKAEQNLAADQQGLAESTQRKYNNQKLLAEQEAARNTQTLNQNVADINRQTQERLVDVARKGEQQLGSANFTGVEGVSNLGNVTGALPTQNQGQVLDLQNKLINRGNPFTF